MSLPDHASPTVMRALERFGERLAHGWAGRFLSREVLMFLAVGGTGYVVDVVTFNLLRSVQPFATLDPSVARTLAVVAAMCITYVGNKTLTWRDEPAQDRRRTRPVESNEPEADLRTRAGLEAPVV